jgi:uncharacterized membrane protein
MSKSKSTQAGPTPEEEAPQDAPPAPAADPLFEDGDAAPDAPGPLDDPEPDGPAEDVAPQPAPDSVSEPVAPPEDIFEPETVADPASVEPEPEPAPAAPEPVEPAAEVAATPEPLVPSPPQPEPEPVLFGPEPWEQAPAPAPLKPGAWADIGPAPAEPAPLPAAPAAAPPRELGAGANAAAFTAGEASHEVKRTAFVIYILYLASPIFGGLSLPVGAYFAYTRKAGAASWLKSHYVFQIRTFWIALFAVAAAIGFLFLPFGLFPLTLIGTVVWVTIRCFFGMVRLNRGEPIFNPRTWIV